MAMGQKPGFLVRPQLIVTLINIDFLKLSNITQYKRIKNMTHKETFFLALLKGLTKPLTSRNIPLKNPKQKNYRNIEKKKKKKTKT